MQKQAGIGWWLLGVLVIGLGVCDAQETTIPELADEDRVRVERYHEALLKRPVRGTLFDRFCEAYTSAAGPEGLRSFLQQRVQENVAETKLADGLLMALYLGRSGEDEAAGELFEKVLKAAGENGESAKFLAAGWWEKSQASVRTGDLKEALKDLQMAAELVSEEDRDEVRRIGLMRGRLLSRTGNRDGALKVWSALAEQFPDDVDLWQDVIDRKVDAGLTDEAMKDLDLLIEREGDAYEKSLLKLRRAEILAKAGRADDAAATLAELLKVTGQGTWIEREVLARYERLFRSRDDLSGLVAALRERLTEEPGRLALQLAEARVLSETGAEEEAMKSWAKVLKLTPGDRGVRERYVMALAGMDRTDEAVSQLQRLVELYPEDAELVLQLAGLQWTEKDGEAAEASVRKYLSIVGGDEVSYVRAISQLQSYDRDDAVEEIYRRWLKEEPGSVPAGDGLAMFLYDGGKREEALELWRTMAGNAGEERLGLIGKRLMDRAETEVAFELVNARREEFTDSFGFLGLLCDTAFATGRTKEAFPWALRRMELAENTEGLATAVRQVLKAARERDDFDDWQAGLEAKPEEQRSGVELCLLAELLLRQQRVADAEKLLSGAREVPGLEGRFLHQELVTLYRDQGNWVRAAKELEAAMEARGSDVTMIQAMVDLYRRAGDFASAFGWIDEWKAAASASSQPWLMEASLAKERGDYEGARDVLEKVARRFEDQQNIWLKLAEVYEELNQWVQAEQVYWRMYEQEEDTARRLDWVRRMALQAMAVDSGAGRSYGRGRGGRLDTLIAEFENRRSRNRKSSEPLLAMARIYAAAENREKQREMLTEAVKLESGSGVLYAELASLEEQDGYADRAVEWLERAVENEPSSSQWKQRLSGLYMLMGNYEKASALMMSGGSGKSLDPGKVEEMVQSLMSVGEWARVVEMLGAVVRLQDHADDYRLWYVYATALRESERYDDAAEAFFRTLRIAQELPEDRLPQTLENSGIRGYSRHATWGGGYGGAYSVYSSAGHGGYQGHLIQPMGWGAIPMDSSQGLVSKEVANLSFVRGVAMSVAQRSQSRPQGWRYDAGGVSEPDPFGSYNAGQDAAWVFPSSLNRAKALAAAHLLTLANRDGSVDQLEVAARKSRWWQALKGEGFGELELRMMLTGMKQGMGANAEQLSEAMGDISVDFKDDLNFLFFQLASGQLALGERTVYRDAAAVFAEEGRADLALYAALKFLTFTGQLAIAQGGGIVSEVDQEKKDAADKWQEELPLARADALLRLQKWRGPIEGALFQGLVMFANSRAGYADRQVANQVEAEGNAQSGFSEEEAAALTSMFDQWVPVDPATDGGSELWTGLAAFSRLVKADEVAALLDHVVEGWKESQASPEQEAHRDTLRAAVAQIDFSTNGLQYARQQAFAVLPGLPWWLTSQPMQSQGGAMSVEVRRELLKSLKDPGLACALAALFSMDEEAGVYFNELEELGQRNITQAYAAAVTAARNGDFSSAQRYLSEAVQQVDREQNLEDAIQIDSLQLALSRANATDKSIREAGRDALKRLLSVNRLDQQSASMVEQAIGEFRMEQEGQVAVMRWRAQAVAKQMKQAKARQLVRANSGNRSMQMLSRQPHMLTQKFGQLVTQGNEGAAVRVVAQQLPLLTGPRLAHWLGRPMQDNYGGLLTQIEKAGLEHRLIEAALPQEKSDFLMRARYGTLLLLLQEWSAAAGVYREVLAERPGDAVIRLRLIEALAAVDVEAAFAELQELASMQAGAELEQTAAILLQWRQSRMQVEQMLGLTELGAMALENGAELAPVEAAGEEGEALSQARLGRRQALFNNLMSTLERQLEDEQIKLPPMVHKALISQKQSKAASERRLGIYERVCRAGLKEPRLAATAFAGLRLVNLHRGGSDADLVATAKEVLMETAEQTTISADFEQMSRQSGGARDPFAPASVVAESQTGITIVAKRGPIELLVEQAFAQKNPGWVYDEVLPAMEARGEKAKLAASGLRQWAGPWLCPPEEFADVWKAFTAAELLTNTQKYWPTLVAVMEQRPEVTIDLGGEIIAGLASPEMQQMATQFLPVYLNRLVEQVKKTDSPEKLEKFVREVLLAMRRRQDEQDKLPGKVAVISTDIDFHRNRARNQPLIAVVESMMKSGGVVLPVLQAVEELVDEGKIESPFGERFSVPFNRRDQKAVNEFLRSLAGCRTVADLPVSELTLNTEGTEKFENWERLFNGAKLTVTSGILQEPVRLEKSKIAAVRAGIPILPTSTRFGERLISALLPDAEPGAVLELFERERPAIDALPEEKRRRFAMFAIDLVETRELESSELGTFRWLIDLAQDTRRQLIDEMVSVERFNDLAFSRTTQDSEWISLMIYAMAYDMEKARPLYRNIMQLAAAEVAAMGKTARNTEDQRYRFWNSLHGSFSNRSLVAEAATLSLSAVKDVPGLALNSGFFDRCADPLENGLPSAKANDGEAQETQKDYLRDVLTQLNTAGAGQIPDGLWIPIFMKLVERSGDADLASKALELIKEDAAQAWSQRLRDQLEAAALVHLARRVREKHRDWQEEGKLDEENRKVLQRAAVAEKRVMDLMSGDSLPLELRLGLSDFWLRLGSDRSFPEEFRQTGRKVLAEVWQAAPGRHWSWTWTLDELHKSALAGEFPGEWWADDAAKLADFLKEKYLGEGEPIEGLDARYMIPKLFLLMMQTGDEDGIVSCLKRHPELLNPPLELWYGLVRGGLYEAAAEMLALRHNDFSGSSSGRYFDAEFALHTREFLDVLDEGPLSVLARVQLESLRDPSTSRSVEKSAAESLPEDWMEWKERMVALGGFVEAADQREALPERIRVKVMATLLRSPGALEVAKNFRIRALEGIDLKQLDRMADRTEQRSQFGILRGVMQAELQTGEYDRYFKVCAEARVLPAASEWAVDINKQLTKMADDFQVGVQRKRIEPEDLLSFRKRELDIELELAAADTGHTGLQRLGHLLEATAGAHQLAGKAADFAGWLQQSPRLLREVAWMHWPVIREKVQRYRPMVRAEYFQWPEQAPAVDASADGFGEALVKNFLNARSVEDWAEAEKFDDTTVRLLQLLATAYEGDDKTDKAALQRAGSVLWHATDLVGKFRNNSSESELKKMDWSFRNGWDYPSDLVEKLVKSSDDLRTLDLALDMLDERMEGGAVTGYQSWGHLQNHRQRIYNLLIAEGVRFELGGSLERTVEKLGIVLRGRTADVSAKIFWELLDTLDNWEREVLAELAKERAADDALWQELEMAIVFYHSVQAMKVGGKAGDDANWQAYYTGKLKDDSIPLSRRFSLIQQVLHRAPVWCDAEFLYAAMDVTTELGIRDGRVHGWILSMVVQRFSRGLPRDDRWQETAERLLQVWSVMTRAPRTGAGAATSKEQGYHPVMDAGLAMRELAHLAEDRVQVGLIDERFADDFSNNSRVLAHYVRFGDFAQAQKFLKNHHSWIGISYYIDEVGVTTARTTYSEELARASEEFLASLGGVSSDAEGLRLLTKIFLEGTPDPHAWELASQGGFPRREERLATIAEKFSLEKISDPAFRERVAGEMAISGFRTAAVTKAIGEVAAASSYKDLTKTKRNSHRTDMLQVFSAAAAEGILAGGEKGGEELAAVFEHCEEAKVPFQLASYWMRREMKRTWPEHRRKGDADQGWAAWCRACLPGVKQYVAWGEKREYTEFLVAAMMANAAAPAPLRRDWTEEKADVADRFSSRMKEQRVRILPTVRDYWFGDVADPREESADSRLPWIEKLFAEPMFVAAYADSKTLFRELLHNDLVTDEELFERAAKWSEQMPRTGMAMVEMAEIYTVLGETDKASRWQKKAADWLHENPQESQLANGSLEVVGIGLAYRKGDLEKMTLLMADYEKNAGDKRDSSVELEISGLRTLLEVAQKAPR